MPEFIIFVANAFAIMLLLLAVIGVATLVAVIVAVIRKDLRDAWESEKDGK